MSTDSTLPTAREVAHAILKKSGWHGIDLCGMHGRHCAACNAITAIIEARDKAHADEVAALRAELETARRDLAVARAEVWGEAAKYASGRRDYWRRLFNETPAGTREGNALNARWDAREDEALVFRDEFEARARAARTGTTGEQARNEGGAAASGSAANGVPSSSVDQSRPPPSGTTGEPPEGGTGGG